MTGPQAHIGEMQSVSKIISGLLTCIRVGSNARKSRLLYELNRAAGGIGATGHSPELGAQLKTLRAELAANAHLVKGHVSALREISEMMIGLVRKDEADGTYVKQQRGYASW
jgi:hypothetical protein